MLLNVEVDADMSRDADKVEKSKVGEEEELNGASPIKMVIAALLLLLSLRTSSALFAVALRWNE